MGLGLLQRTVIWKGGEEEGQRGRMKGGMRPSLLMLAGGQHLIPQVELSIGFETPHSSLYSQILFTRASSALGSIHNRWHVGKLTNAKLINTRFLIILTTTQY